MGAGAAGLRGDELPAGAAFDQPVHLHPADAVAQLSRQRDGVWHGCGIGLTRWIRPVMWYALPVVGLIALLSLVLSPGRCRRPESTSANWKAATMSRGYPGTFRESKQADRYIHRERESGFQPGRQRFRAVDAERQAGTMVAKEGCRRRCRTATASWCCSMALATRGLPDSVTTTSSSSSVTRPYRQRPAKEASRWVRDVSRNCCRSAV